MQNGVTYSLTDIHTDGHILLQFKGYLKVGDGKTVAPLQKRLEGVSELSKHKDDKVPLKQESKMPKSPFSFCV